MINKVKVVIVGGGFGGVYTAKHLYEIFNRESIEITLINKSNYFLFTPLLHEVATGGLTPDSIIESTREVFRDTCVKFIEDNVIDIDKVGKTVKTTSNSFSYDYLVISTGAETNYFKTPGAKEHSFSLKNLEDAIALRNHVLQTCEKAVATKNKELLTVAIVGAGPTGVELAGELIEYMQHTLCTYYRDSGFKREDIKINLITATPDVISQFPQKMRDIAMVELNKKGITVMINISVTKVEPNLLTFKEGKTLKVHTIVWVAGVIPPDGKIEVNEYLQTINNPEVFALGDVAGKYPMLAQVAVQQGLIVAHNISASVNKTPMEEFEFEQLGLLISIGQWFAIGHFFGITLKGRIMWLLWRTIYLFNFISWRRRFEISFEWISNLFYPRDITYLK